jgi:DNA repair protein RadD
MSAILRPQQQRLLDDIRRTLLEGCSRLMIQAPTGFGKTIVAANIAKEIQASGKRMIFTVPALSLIDQTVEKFYAEGVRDIGVIQANHVLTNYARRIQVASVQTLQRRGIPPADLVLIDEAHRWFDFYAEWLGNPAWSNVPFIGLTATPWTRGLRKYFDKLIIAATTQELIDADYLSRFRVFAPSSPDLEGVRTVAGDYHEGDLSAAMDKSALVADVVNTWIERSQGRPTLCFAVDRAHAKHLQEKAGVPRQAEICFNHFSRGPGPAIRRSFRSGQNRCSLKHAACGHQRRAKRRFEGRHAHDRGIGHRKKVLRCGAKAAARRIFRYRSKFSHCFQPRRLTVPFP